MVEHINKKSTHSFYDSFVTSSNAWLNFVQYGDAFFHFNMWNRRKFDLIINQ